MFSTGSNIVIDMHSDIATDIAIRRAAGEHQVFKRHHFEKLKQAGVRGVFSVLWVEPEYRHRSAARLVQLLGALLADVQECSDCVELVTSEKALVKTIDIGKIGLVLGVEGMTFVEQWPSFEQEGGKESAVASAHMADVFDAASLTLLNEKLLQSLAILKLLGLRHTIFVWGEDNAIASGPIPSHGESTNRGLTEFGRQVVQTLQAQNIMVDVSHLDDKSTEVVLAATNGVVMASHSNARALCDVPRNLIDTHIDEIGRRGGVIGINAYPDFIHESDSSLDRFIDHIVYIGNRIGLQHVGLGFDFTDFLDTENGGRGRDVIGLHSASDVPSLIQRMSERGFSASEIVGVTHQNALRILGSLT